MHGTLALHLLPRMRPKHTLHDAAMAQVAQIGCAAQVVLWKPGLGCISRAFLLDEAFTSPPCSLRIGL